MVKRRQQEGWRGWGWKPQHLRRERNVFLYLLAHIFLLVWSVHMHVFVFLCLRTLVGSSRLLPACLTASSQGVFLSLSFCICSIFAPSVRKFPLKAPSELQAPQDLRIPKAPYTQEPLRLHAGPQGIPPQEPQGLSDGKAAALHKSAIARGEGKSCLGIQLRTCFT